MNLVIHREARFNKSLSILRRSGGKAALAARRAEEVIERLATEGRMAAEEFSRLTKHGELRIRKCKKYDLGGGYRLIGVKQGKHLIFSYVGTHDDCDRWIENNRGFELEVDEVTRETPQPERRYKEESSPRTEVAPETDYDELLLEKVDEKTLRRIFCGICGETA